MIELIVNIDCVISESELSYKRILDEDTLLFFYDSLKEKHQFDYNRLFIWETVNNSSAAYGNDWEKLLGEELKLLDEEIFLVVCDEERFPWPIYRGLKSELLGLLSSQRFFEYFIFDHKMDRVVFDTHENTFIVSQAT